MSDEGASDLAKEIDAAPIGPLQIRVLTLCLAVSMLDGFDTQSIAFVAPSIAESWHLLPLQFSLIFSATMAGTALGAAVFGRIADRYGRRRLITASVVLFGLMAFACGASTGFKSLLIFRFLAGLGLGGAIPNFIALASEFAPARARARLIVATLWGFPLGAVVGGLLSAPAIDRFGWRSVFVAGGALPLVLAPCLWFLLPESIRYLRDQEAAGGRVARLGEVFEGRLAPGTLLLGGALFMSLLLAYLLVNWIPLLFRQIGLPIGTAVLGTVFLNAGGIAGSYVISRVIDRSRHALVTLAVSYALAALAVAALGIGGLPSGALLAFVAATGFFLIGNQMSLSAFIADYYPSALRATGLGVTQAMGRCGSLVGPLVAGQLLASGSIAPQIFRLGAIPALAAVGALLTLRSIQPTRA